ncbi:hypothetical protein LUZ60_009158 [Juncus effusus]|nr:hypothetical protein LUZ60_009158 [Juncus effusus]
MAASSMMDIDPQVTPDDRIVEKLIELGVSPDLLALTPPQSALLKFHYQNPNSLQTLVSTILSSSPSPSSALDWIQWLMFGSNPKSALQTLADRSAGTRGVCGSVWGNNDLAYRCRTCESDPTCAICVPCFQNGNHQGHDYSIMYTGGGCCDCGDITAWKKEGFCKRHKGAEKIEPLDAELAKSVGPVLDCLLDYWKDKLEAAHRDRINREGLTGDSDDVAETLTISIADMVLEFSSHSESLLSFVSSHIHSKPALLSLLLNSEKFLSKSTAKKLHELFLKFIGDPSFKLQFCLSFVEYYRGVVREILTRGNSGSGGADQALGELYPLLNSFSVQIFTVPVMMDRLVRETDLLGTLVSMLRDVLMACLDEEGKFQVNKWTNYYEIVMRLVDDIKFIITHKSVSAYLSQSRPDILSSWIQILQTLQFMDAHKRVMTTHTDDENENLAAPFVLSSYLGTVNSAICQGAFGKFPAKGKEVTDVTNLMEGTHRDAKVGRLVNSGEDLGTGEDCGLNSPVLSPFVGFLVKTIVGCIENWLRPEFVSLKGESGKDDYSSSSNFNFGSISSSPIKVGRFGNLQLINKGKNVLTRCNLSSSAYPCPAENKIQICKLSDGSLVYADPGTEIDADGDSSDSPFLFKLEGPVWFYVSFDVSSQETSFHLPLHRFLSLLLRRSLNWIYGENQNGSKRVGDGSEKDGFFERVFEGFRLPCLAAVLVEHPLRIRVFCAQVRAGMWRKNGDAVILSTDWYRMVQWLEEGLESDLFLMQCCAALAPPESFVRAVQDRFGLNSYTSLNLSDHNEYEGVLVQEMLTFLIQLIKERRFCGFSTTDNLKREIVFKLSVIDATHSQLVKSLPRDLSKNQKLQQVLDSLALYSNPSGMKQGKYSLKNEHWTDLDLYHPRWSSRDLQSAEERFFRFCKISPLNSQIPKWTPIFSPLSNIRQIATCRAALDLIRSVLYYSVFGELASVSRASETVLVLALHLTSLALDISEKELKGKPGIEIPVLKHASEEFGNAERKFGKKHSLLTLLLVLNKRYKEENEGGKFSNISGLIEGLLRKFAELDEECMRVVREIEPGLVADVAGQTGGGSGSELDPNVDKRAKARQRQAAILAKMKAEQSKFADSMKSESSEDPKPDKGSSNNNNSDLMDIQSQEEEESVPACSLCHDSYSQSPLCYLILLQKSKLVTFAEKGTPSWDEVGSSSSSSSSSNNNNNITSGFWSNSNGSGFDSFDEPGSPFGPEISLEEYSIELDPSSDDDLSISLSHDHFSPPQNPNPNSLSSPEKPYSLVSIEEEIHNMILQELSKLKNGESALEKCEKGKITKTPSVAGIYASCLKRNSSSSSSPSSSRSKITKMALRSSMGLFSRHTSLVSPKREKVSGSVSSQTGRVRRFGPVDCDGVHVSSCGHAVHQECHERYLFSLKQRYIRRLGFEGGHIVDPDKGESLCPVCRRFANSILPASQNPSSKTLKSPKNTQNAPHDTLSPLTVSLSLLQTASKTVSNDSFLKLISSIPKQNSSPSSSSDDASLHPSIKKLASLYFPSNSMQFSSEDRMSHPLLYWDALRYSTICAEIAARGQKRNCVECLDAELNSSSGFILSLLTGVARDSRSLSCTDVLLRYNGLNSLVGSVCFGYSVRGTYHVAEVTDEGETYPDVLFWKELADPVLTRDPFSSLLWTLFCLPAPFLSSHEFFWPLVHLFYLVSLVQALITCYSQSLCDTSCFSNSPLHGIIKQIASSDSAKSFFLSNSSDAFSSPSECVRRLTFPYLRRVYLLNKLLTSALRKPLYASSTAGVWDRSGLRVDQTRDPVDRARLVRAELEGLRELEASIGVMSLEAVMNDELACGLAVKWCYHLSEEFNNNNSGNCFNDGNNNLGVFYCVPAVPFRLLQLPLLYQDLLQRYVKRQCGEQECNKVPDEPALCLFCGKLCSPSWKFCCRPSKCQNHATTCGAGIGVFLLIRKTTILLQRSLRLAFWPSPYLDAFGEEDHDMQRGRPLYLSEERYAALTHLVASHSLDRTPEVLRQTTIGLYAGD